MFLLCSPQRRAEWKTWQHENVTVKKQPNVITQDERINMERDEMNDVVNLFIPHKIVKSNDSVNTWLGKSHTDSQRLAVSETTLSKTG